VHVQSLGDQHATGAPQRPPPPPAAKSSGERSSGKQQKPAAAAAAAAEQKAESSKTLARERRIGRGRRKEKTDQAAGLAPKITPGRRFLPTASKTGGGNESRKRQWRLCHSPGC